MRSKCGGDYIIEESRDEGQEKCGSEEEIQKNKTKNSISYAEAVKKVQQKGKNEADRMNQTRGQKEVRQTIQMH